jgi:hypothetical protein
MKDTVMVIAFWVVAAVVGFLCWLTVHQAALVVQRQCEQGIRDCR